MLSKKYYMVRHGTYCNYDRTLFKGVIQIGNDKYQEFKGKATILSGDCFCLTIALQKACGSSPYRFHYMNPNQNHVYYQDPELGWLSTSEYVDKIRERSGG